MVIPMWVAILGWVCAVLGAVLALPQLIKLFKTRDTAGVSLLNWQLVVGSGLAWTWHGIDVGQAPVWVPNLLMGLSGLAIVWMICTHRKISLPKTLLLPAGVMVVSLLIDNFNRFLGAAPDSAQATLAHSVFGFVVNIPQMIGVLAQMRSIIREPDLKGFSIAYMGMLCSVQYLWLIWSLFSGESAIRVGAGAMAALTTVAIIVYVLRQIGVIKPKQDTEAPAAQDEPLVP